MQEFLEALMPRILRNSLEIGIEVQILDPEFDCDVETEEGRAALAARIEELRGEV